MISQEQLSLSLFSQLLLSLSYALQISASNYVLNREAEFLFILVSNFTLTHQGQIL